MATRPSWLNVLGPLGGLVAGIQNAQSKYNPTPAKFVQNVAKNFGTSTTKPASASGLDYSTQDKKTPTLVFGNGPLVTDLKPIVTDFKPNPPIKTDGVGSNNQDFYNQGIGNIQSQGNEGLDFIEQDYSNALGALAGQEESLRGQAGTAQGQIENEAGSVRTQLGKEQGTAETGIQSNLSTAETQGASQLQQARDLFRQTQQGNIAQLSALGISSSSVSEALAERLGVETARRIAGVTGSLSEVRQNATKELGRIKDYYQSRLTDVTNQVATQKANIQNSLMQGLNQINSARNQAATDKSRSRAELLNNVQNSIAQLTQQQQQFEQSLKQWASQKQAALTPIITDPSFIDTLTSATDTFNDKFAPQGFQYVPDVNTDAYGRVQGQVKYSSTKVKDDLSNPFET